MPPRGRKVPVKRKAPPLATPSENDGVQNMANDGGEVEEIGSPAIAGEDNKENVAVHTKMEIVEETVVKEVTVTQVDGTSEVSLEQDPGQRNEANKNAASGIIEQADVTDAKEANEGSEKETLPENNNQGVEERASEDVGDDHSATDDDDEENEDMDDPFFYLQLPLSERIKEKQLEIFIGGLDKSTVTDDLINVFGKFGEVLDARVVKHPVTKKSKGFGFVRFAAVEQTKEALSEFKDGVEIRGKWVSISASQDNDTLFVKNICKTWTREHVLETLTSIGIENLEEIYLPEDPEKDGHTQGFAFLEFSSHSDAMAAFKKLKMPNAIFGCDRSIGVSFAQSSMHPSEEALSQVKAVYIENVPDSWDEEMIKQHCLTYGEIENVQLSRNSSVAKCKDCGFITYSSREGAVACLEGINNAQVAEGENKLRASLGKPLNKGRLAKLGSYGGFKIKKNQEDALTNPLPSRRKLSESKRAKWKGKPWERKRRARLPAKADVSAPGSEEVRRSNDQQDKGKKLRGAKRGRRGDELSNASRPQKKARGNLHSRPRRDFAGRPLGNSRGKYPLRQAPYRDPHVSRFDGSTQSYLGTAYGAGPEPKLRSSDMAPHAGYITSTKKGQNTYRQNRSGISGDLGQRSQGADYLGHGGYQAGYAYASGAGAYANDVPYAASSVSYPFVKAYTSAAGAYALSRDLLYPSQGRYF